MANKRMFARTIIDSDAFLDMPLSTQSLYFHLSMRADDDGFVNNPKKITRMIGCGEDDFKLLIAKRFLLLFESGVVVIKHWLIHNTIRKDRKTPTNYQDEYRQLAEKDNGSYTKLDTVAVSERRDITPKDEIEQLTTTWQPDDNQVTTKCPHSVVEISVVEVSRDKTSTKHKSTPTVSESQLKSDFDNLWALYPNKKAKQKAYTSYKKAIKDGTTNKEIQDGIQAYVREIEVKRTEPKYIAHGSTWFGNKRWEDDYQSSQFKSKELTNQERITVADEEIPF